MFWGVTILGKGNHRDKPLWDWSVIGRQNKCVANSKNSFYALLAFFSFIFSRNFNTSSIYNQCPVINEMISKDDRGCDKDGRTVVSSKV